MMTNRCPKAPLVERRGFFRRRMASGQHAWRTSIYYWGLERWEVYKTCKHCGARTKSPPLTDLDLQREGVDVAALREAFNNIRPYSARSVFSWEVPE